MPLFLLLLGGAAIGAYFALRNSSNIAAVDNLKINSGVIDDTTDISSSNEVQAVKNNNPLNIRTSSDNWVGLANPRAVNGFCNFTSPEYGYRAGRIILSNYKKRGIETLSAIIKTWAPPSENNTEAYINFVSAKSGLSPSTIIDSSNIAKLFYAMTIIETGKALPMATINKGLLL